TPVAKPCQRSCPARQPRSGANLIVRNVRPRTRGLAGGSPMARLEPIPAEQLSPYFRDLLAADEKAGRDPALNGVMAHHPKFFEDYFSFYYPNHEQGLVESRVKELARLKIARLNGCQTCAMARYASATREGLDEACIVQLDLPSDEQSF